MYFCVYLCFYPSVCLITLTVTNQLIVDFSVKDFSFLQKKNYYRPMTLEGLLLSDYGNIIKEVGEFLLKHNSSSLKQIQQSTTLTKKEIVDSLSVLIQKRFVKFFIFENTFKYNIDRSMVKRRLYYPIYINYITNNYSVEFTELFTAVLIKGTFKEDGNNSILEELLAENVIKNDPFNNSNENYEENKHFKPNQRFLIVNFDFLDQKVFEEETIHMISKRYNEAAASVLRAVLKCETIDKNSIIKNLESTKILISDKGAILNEKENITEYLRYLCNSGVLKHGFDENRMYFYNSSRTALKSYRILLLLKDTAMRRIFKMVYEKAEVEDKNITIYSLLGINKVKLALLSLQKLGLLSQKCLTSYSVGSRVEHSWYIDINAASLSMLKKIEQEIEIKLLKINGNWDTNYFYESTGGNNNVWMSDLISLATEHLVLGIDLL